VGKTVSSATACERLAVLNWRSFYLLSLLLLLWGFTEVQHFDNKFHDVTFIGNNFKTVCISVSLSVLMAICQVDMVYLVPESLNSGFYWS